MQALGVEHFFLMTGRDNRLWIALEAAGIHQVLARSEAAAVYMADGYALASGAHRPSSTAVRARCRERRRRSGRTVLGRQPCRGPGVGHAPLGSLSPQYQELEQPALFASVTKWGIEASVATHVPRLVREAARHAITGAPGRSTWASPMTSSKRTCPATPGRRRSTRSSRSRTSTRADCRRCGGRGARPRLGHPADHPRGRWHPPVGAHDALRQFAERLSIPVATSNSPGSIAETHDLALGSVGRYSRNYANAAFKDADVVLAVGTALGVVTDSYRLVAVHGSSTSRSTPTSSA